MIRARASTKKRKRFAKLFTPPVLPDNLPVIRTADGKFKLPGDVIHTCACGEPWSVAFPGSIAFPVTTVNHLGMTCAPEPAVAARDDLFLCMACAGERGWPNISSETIGGKEDESAVKLHRATSAAACGDGKAGDQEGD